MYCIYSHISWQFLPILTFKFCGSAYMQFMPRSQLTFDTIPTLRPCNDGHSAKATHKLSVGMHVKRTACCCSHSCKRVDTQPLSRHWSRVVIHHHFSWLAYMEVTNFARFLAMGIGSRLMCGRTYTWMYTIFVLISNINSLIQQYHAIIWTYYYMCDVLRVLCDFACNVHDVELIGYIHEVCYMLPKVLSWYGTNC